MTTLCDIITCAAVFALMAGFCMLERNPVAAFFIMFVSGIWIAIRTYAYEEKRMRGGR